jgi:hypothetical protein
MLAPQDPQVPRPSGSECALDTGAGCARPRPEGGSFCSHLPGDSGHRRSDLESQCAADSWTLKVLLAFCHDATEAARRRCQRGTPGPCHARTLRFTKDARAPSPKGYHAHKPAAAAAGPADGPTRSLTQAWTRLIVIVILQNKSISHSGSGLQVTHRLMFKLWALLRIELGTSSTGPATRAEDGLPVALRLPL